MLYLYIESKNYEVVFGYVKVCKIGLFSIDITPGIYVPYRSEFYAVKDGITQVPYRVASHTMTVRRDEMISHFYLTSDNQVTISYPQIKSTNSDDGIKPSVTVVGQNSEDYDAIEITGDGSVLIFEVKYECSKKGKSDNKLQGTFM